MIQEKARIHIFRAQFKIKDVEIFNNSFLPNGFGNDNYSSLGQPAKNYLGDAFFVLCGDGGVAVITGRTR